jgi:serine-type D-Ala-D-Ala carboxypeptidase
VAGSRALGWDTCEGDGDGGCGDYLDTDAYGHTGFTGTSIWIDPDRQMFVILLTNRVYEPRVRYSTKAIADVRADLADASVLALQDETDLPAVLPAAWRTDRQLGWYHQLRKPHRRKTSSHPASKARGH